MALQDAGEELISRYLDISIAVVTEFELARSEGEHLIETSGDSHAGEIETSRILHTHPNLVKGRAAREFPAFPPWLLVRNKRRYWPNGVWGDPTKASSEKGRLIEELVVNKIVAMVRVLKDFQETPQSEFPI